ncbi:tRNAHis guanylyltransferase-domain-containing protein [Mycena crocata]|nr:tRNAHis guanylyltransferase-domain-containing protein [Mycena crocata]
MAAQPELEGASETLGERMKRYEATTEQRLPEDQPIILRLDGHGFSKFTSSFEKPFDTRLHDAMAQTAADLLTYFSDASLAYTQSDEITLIFPTCRVFSGRVTKIASLAAGYTTARFNHHLAHGATGSEPVPAHKLGVAHFDARVFAVPDAAEALNNLIWRSKFDCRRNSISAFGRSFYSAKQLKGVSANEVVEKLLAEKNVDFWTATPGWAHYGTTVKRELYEGTGKDGLTGEEVKMTRTRMRPQDIPWWEFNEKNLSLITSRYWPSEEVTDN